MKEYIHIKEIDLKKNLPEILKAQSSILNKETFEYLEALLNLEISALKKDAVSDDVLKQLMELSFFKKLVTYNLYHKADELKKKDEKRHLLSCMHCFMVEHRDLEKTELLKFIYDEMILNLYQESPTSYEESIKKRDDEIIKLEKRMDYLLKIGISCESHKSELTYTAQRLKTLKRLTDDAIKQQCKIKKQDCEKQQIMLQQVLEQNDLSISDFEELELHGGKKFLIKKYPHASIYIQK